MQQSPQERVPDLADPDNLAATVVGANTLSCVALTAAQVIPLTAAGTVFTSSEAAVVVQFAGLRRARRGRA